MHEFNGDWYPWGGTVNGNSPALFVEAWRRMVDIFHRHGADNVRFVWSPNNIDVPASNRLESYYPGEAYVDVLAVDGYNWGAGTPAYGGWKSFSEVFMPAYDRLRALGPQPIWLGRGRHEPRRRRQGRLDPRHVRARARHGSPAGARRLRSAPPPPRGGSFRSCR